MKLASEQREVQVTFRVPEPVMPTATEWTSSRPYVWRDLVLAGGGWTSLGSVTEYCNGHGLERMVRGIGAGGDTLYVGTLRGEVYALVGPAERIKSGPELDRR